MRIKLRNGVLPFKEEGLNALFEKTKKNFDVTTEYKGIMDADAIIVYVSTPIKEKNIMEKYVFLRQW